MKQWMSYLGLGNDEAQRLDTAVDQQLRAGTTPPDVTPAWLHASIMNAVGQSEAEESSARGWSRLVWALPVVPVALLAGLLALRSPSTHRLEMATGINPAPQLADAAWQHAALAVEPLDKELANLTRDWERTQQFLLASLP